MKIDVQKRLIEIKFKEHFIENVSARRETRVRSGIEHDFIK